MGLMWRRGTDDVLTGRYVDEPPIPFAGRIVNILLDHPEIMRGRGHRVVERGDRGGFTVRYDGGPKRGLAIHFMSLQELTETLDPWFAPLVPTRERVASRESPKCGSWAQWEGVWVRR